MHLDLINIFPCLRYLHQDTSEFDRDITEHQGLAPPVRWVLALDRVRIMVALRAALGYFERTIEAKKRMVVPGLGGFGFEA